MHIAINGWFWDQPDTGSGQYLRELLRAMNRTNPEVRFSLVLPAKVQTINDLPDGVEALRLGGGRGKFGKVWFEQQLFPGAVKKLEADIAHVPYWGPPLSSPAPIVTSVLDVIPLLFPEYAGGFLTRLYTSLVTAAARGSQHIITLSEAAKTDVVAQLQVPEARVTAIHLAAKEAYHPMIGAERDEDVRRKYNLPEEPFVLYLGGFDLRKRVAQLVSAYSYVAKAHGPETPLVLAGQEPDWNNPLFPNIRAYAAATDIPEENLIWPGYIAEEDKPALYRLADVFVYPSAYEGFGLPLLEAMASGTPAVANEIPVFEEIAGDGAFLTEDGNSTRMGGALLALLEQKPLYESMVNAGIARASNFTWRKTAKATLEVYEQVLSSVKASGDQTGGA